MGQERRARPGGGKRKAVLVAGGAGVDYLRCSFGENRITEAMILSLLEKVEKAEVEMGR